MEERDASDILNDTDRTLSERFRALFTLRTQGKDVAIQAISQCLLEEKSALLKHECAYCLGQMQDSGALPVLKRVLSDTSEDPMVRHEAGEALGAIGDASVIPFLTQYLDDNFPEVAETCKLAIDRLEWLGDKDSGTFCDTNPYLSVDPAPPTNKGTIKDWEAQLNNTSLSLFARYRALFALRNRGGVDAVQALSTGFKDESILFKHEIAYVLGQMQDPAAIQALTQVLQDSSESAMVRHECAEALGSIATEECLQVLTKYCEDSECVVSESCYVALDMYKNEHDFLPIK